MANCAGGHQYKSSGKPDHRGNRQNRASRDEVLKKTSPHPRSSRSAQDCAVKEVWRTRSEHDRQTDTDPNDCGSQGDGSAETKAVSHHLRRRARAEDNGVVELVTHGTATWGSDSLD